MIKKSIISIILLVASISTLYSDETIEYKIFTASEIEESRRGMFNWKLASPFWTPSLNRHDIQAILKNVGTHLETYYIEKIDGHSLQVVGMTQGKKQVLYLNFYKTSREIEGVVNVMDGGNNYIQIIYDPDNQLILYANVNGEA